MKRAIVNSGGLGASYEIDCSGGATNGMTIDCDSWANFFNVTCWGLCSASSVSGGATAPTGGGATDAPPVVSPSPLCSFLACDSSGNIEFSSSNLIFFGGAVAAVFALLLVFKK